MDMILQRLFGKYAMSRYPKPSARKYASISDYRGYSVALYRSPDGPAFTYGEIPLYDLYFIIDDMGDIVLPVDIPFASPFEACMAIDLFHYLDSNPRWKLANPNETIWNYLVQNKCMERNVYQIMDLLRNLKLAMQEFNSDPDFGDDPVKFVADQVASIDRILQQIPGWRNVQNYDIPN
jgi:hypothetical protein